MSCMLLFLSCQAEQGNYTTVSQNGQYVYGVWKARTTKAAKDLSRQITQAWTEDLPQIDALSLITTAKPVELLPADGEAAHWVRVGKPSVDIGKDLYKNVIGGAPGTISQLRVYRTSVCRVSNTSTWISAADSFRSFRHGNARKCIRSL